MSTITQDTEDRRLRMAPIAVRIIHCPRPGCTFSASAHTEGRAIRELAHHLVTVHVKEQQ